MKFQPILISIFILLAGATAQDFDWPTNNGRHLSSNFGEFRTDHFHMGLDIRTNGTNGMPIHAVYDGYIEKISASYTGYGKALYLVTNNGYRIVFGHLDSFSPTMESVLRNQQEKENSYSVRLNFLPGEFPVNKGDIVGYSGNRGHSFAPHLHFELRDTNDLALNPQKHGFAIPDRLSPVIEALTIIPLKTGTRINGGNLSQTFPAYRDIAGIYHLPDTINCQGTIGLSIKVHDRASGSPYKYNIFRMELKIDGQTRFTTQYDALDYTQAKLVTIAEDHYLQRLRDEDHHRLYHLPHYPPVSVHDNQSDGILNLLPGPHDLEILVTDNAGNTSTLKERLLALPGGSITVETYHQTATTLTFEILPQGSSIPLQQVTCYSFTPFGYADQEVQPVAVEKSAKGLLFTVSKSAINNRILQFISKNKMGLYAAPYHWDSFVQPEDPLELGVNLDIFHTESGVHLQVETSAYSRLTPDVRLQGLFADRPIKMIQVRPNTFLSELVNPAKFNRIDNIIVTYHSEPEREFRFPFQGIVSRPGKSQVVVTNDRLCSMQALKDSFYDTTVIWIEPVDQPVRSESGELLSAVYQLQPFNLPLKDTVRVAIRYTEDQAKIDRKALYYFDKEKGWKYLSTRHRLDRQTLIASLNSVEAVAVLRDTIPPQIKSSYPGNGGHYHYQDVQRLYAVFDDDLAGIQASPDNMFMMLDGELLLFDYQPIKKVISYRLDIPLDAGSHELIISVTDQVGNSTTRKINFSVN